MKKIYLSLQVGLEGMLFQLKLSLINLSQNDYKVTWIGTKAGIENKLINDPNINMHYINSTGVRGKTFFK